MRHLCLAVGRCDVSCPVCRSPTVIIGYLMKLRGWRLAESYKWVKDKRPNIKISEGVRRETLRLLHVATGLLSLA